MQKLQKILLATAVLLALTTAAVLANGPDEATDWWTEMTEHHEETHGDDFETHHQGMHGDDWQEHVEGCHEATENENTGMGGNMGSNTGFMMGATMM
jgi:hypothetical protein